MFVSSDDQQGITEMSTTYQAWLETKAAKFHSKPRKTVVIRPLSPHAYAAELAARTLNASR